MNTRHRNIKFTAEEEQDNKISFLDISITRVGNELQTYYFARRHSVVYISTFTAIFQICTRKV